MYIAENGRNFIGNGCMPQISVLSVRDSFGSFIGAQAGLIEVLRPRSTCFSHGDTALEYVTPTLLEKYRTEFLPKAFGSSAPEVRG